MTNPEPTVDEPQRPAGRIARARQTYDAASPDQRKRWQRLLTIGWLVVLAILAVWLLRNERQQLQDIWTNLKNADRSWLTAAAIAEICGISSVAWTFKITLDRLGHNVPLRYLISLHLQRAGVNFAAPFGTAVTGYIFMERTARKGVPGENALLTLAIRSMSVWGATIIVLFITAIISGRPLLIAVSVVAMIAAVVASFVVARKGQGDWKTLLRWSKRLPDKYATRAEKAVESIKAHHLTPADLLGSIGTTLITRTATITLIYACVRALGETPSISTVLFAYVTSFVAGRLVPFLYGMGAIETTLSLTLEAGGVPLDIAIGAALLFRFFDFLLPSVIGLGLYAWNERHGVRGVAVPGSAEE